ncbi:MAG: aminopeptidase P family N-terminal domain-containing protein, partial [Anaerolineales bacterium]|nr:aminopeptidase P family N-terminal domain-containing protein [Anaerolineales bacterium]
MSLSDVFWDRIHRLQTQLELQAVDLLVIAPTVNMRYLLGFATFADERPCFLLVGKKSIGLVVPDVNAEQFIAHTGLHPIRWTDCAGPNLAIREALSNMNVQAGCELAVDNAMRADAL